MAINYMSMEQTKIQLQILSSNLRRANNDIEFIWKKIFDFDIEQIKRCWNAKELEVFIEKMYDLDRQMIYIYNYADDICTKIDNKFDKL